MNLNFPPTLNAASFLERYWQKRPLLIRNALPDYVLPLDGDDLAGLALEASIESRIVLERGGEHPWQAEQGPFDAARFANLPPSHWTLLIQDAEKQVPEVAMLLESFSFLPQWRLDDIMISYAADQGSVGPHVDDYDVFLLQAAGRRRWQIEEEERSEAEYIPGLDLRILPDFQPSREWVLEPGDLLYLPPHIPHWGKAEGEGCITCSVGYRAPRLDAMVADWCDHLVLNQVPATRYRDGPMLPQRNSAELDADVVLRIQEELSTYLQQNPVAFARWFGGFISEPKEHLQVEPRDEPLDPAVFMASWRRHGSIERDNWAKFLFYSDGEEACQLFVNGEGFTLPIALRPLIELICGARTLDYASCKGLADERQSRELLTTLYNHGYLHFS